MAKNRLDIGDIVASSMQQIIHSDEHRKTFYKKAEACCKCDKCGEKCFCAEKCVKDCKGCVKDTNHVHDNKCDHEKTSAVNEIIELLSKISSIQEELGLTKSSLTTLQALAVMVGELKKTAQEDTNDISYDELIQSIDDPDARRSGRLDYYEHPDIAALLRQRVQESEDGELSLPVNIFDDVSADAVSDFPETHVFSPFDEGELQTWAPDGAGSETEMPPASLRLDRPLPSVGRLPDIDREELDRTDLLRREEERDMPTMPPEKDAFERLNVFLKKQAQEDGDFEDEDDAVLQSLMGDFSEDQDDADGLLSEEYDPDFFGIENDESFADDESFLGSDLDQELESGDFLESPDSDPFYDFDHEREDADPGFVYPGLGQKDLDTVRMPGRGWVPFKDLDEEEMDELESGAGMRERLDIDPDQITDEEAYADEFDNVARDMAFDPESRMIGQIGSMYDQIYNSDPEDDEYAPEKAKFWND